MKLTIEIDHDAYVQSYLSILSLGILECLEKKLISYDDAMNLLYFPGIIDQFEALFPDLGRAIHLGTELEDVAELIPEKLEQSIDEIRALNDRSIQFSEDAKQHVFYKVNEMDDAILNGFMDR